MSCWEVLQLEPTNDKKQIKSAYAKLLKITRPEEKPEEFQALYTAYQQALHYADVELGDTSDSYDEITSPVETVSIKSTTDKTDLEADTALENQEILEYTSSLEAEWLKVKSRIESLLTEPVGLNEPMNWRFLERSPLLNDLMERQRLSVYIFGVVSGVNYATLTESPPSLAIQRSILIYLNKLFDWENNWRYFQNYATDERMNAVFSYLRASPTQNHRDTRLTEPAVDFVPWAFLFIKGLVASIINMIFAAFLLAFAISLNFFLVFPVII